MWSHERPSFSLSIITLYNAMYLAKPLKIRQNREIGKTYKLALYNVIIVVIPESLDKMARGDSLGPQGRCRPPRVKNMTQMHQMLSVLLSMLISVHFPEHSNFFFIISQTRHLQDMW